VTQTVYRQCTLCEAHCGIQVEVEDNRVVRISGDPDDVLSHGYICPKAAALADVYSDPDRLRRPVKKVDGRFVQIGWSEALDLAAAGMRRVQERHGTDALATYIGNPPAHSSGIFAAALLRKLLGTSNNYSAASTDQLPHYMSSFEMFGHFFILPVPDIERTQHMLLIGANPAVSNGSLMTAPGIRDRLKAIRQRGGKVVVIDPRRTETARHASEHVAVRPGGDPYLLLAMLSTIFADGSEHLGKLEGSCDGMAELRALAGEYPPEHAAPLAGVDAATIERLAREFAASPSAVAYGRVGVCQQRTGSLTSWLINALNLVTGNMDNPGGAMFPKPAIDVQALVDPLAGKPGWGRLRQRVSGLPEFADEFPVAGLAAEMLTPGEGQIRGMLVYGGNPVLSAPGGNRLEEAVEQLEWCVAVDMYVTETSRHADVILPPLAHLERSDVDFVFGALSVRNQIRYNPAAVTGPSDGKTDWEIMMALAARVGRGRRGALANGVMRFLGSRVTPERVADLALRVGPYGRLRSSHALNLSKVRGSVHGIDLGPLEPNLANVIRTQDKRVKLAPPVLLAEARRLEELAAEREHAHKAGYDLTLVGRRSLRSNNSWLHNSRRLMKGSDRCTALLHPDDAATRGLSPGQTVRVSSATGAIEVPLELSDEMRPGVVSVPHGFGHGHADVGWRTAASHPGASVNDITDPTIVDQLSGNAAFNDVPVRIDAVLSAEGTEAASLDAISS
jgi:anaerobic selenocysteine-containing dehydrogenase